MNFRQELQEEFARRRRGNPPYSLRAFARYLGTDHSTLSQILRGRRNLSPRMVRLFGRRLRLGPGVIIEACVEQDSQVVLRLVESKSLRPNSRWIAIRTGIPLNGVNAALHWLLHTGELSMLSPAHWRVNRQPDAGAARLKRGEGISPALLPRLQRRGKVRGKELVNRNPNNKTKIIYA